MVRDRSRRHPLHVPPGRLAFPQLGSERVAFRLVVRAPDVSAIVGRVDTAVVRVKNAATVLSLIRFEPAGSTDLEELTRLSVSRVRAIT